MVYHIYQGREIQGFTLSREPYATESIKFDGIIGIIATQKKKRFSPTSIPFG